MILLDKPYVSEFLAETIRKNNYPVLKTQNSLNVLPENHIPYIEEEDLIKQIKNNPETLVYSNSENTISWVEKNLGFTVLPEKIKLFKNKAAFRKIIQPLFPDYFFQEIPYDRLDQADPKKFKYPFIIKPSVGFFSLGIYRVNSESEWETTIEKIRKDSREMESYYPPEVINASSFLAEELIEGEEFAIDVYYNKSGEANILGILKHLFSSEEDFSDRCYTTSYDVIRENLEDFQHFLDEMGKITNLSNFPCHVEVRKTPEGQVIPIEVNPLRFGGWCSTADLTHHAFGFNPYEYFFNQQKADWDKLLEGKENEIYSLVILDNSTGYPIEQIKSFDYEKMISVFSNPLELRKIDYQEYPVFAFLFVETSKQDPSELDFILHSDLKEYVELKG